jgi:uncharacterized protein
MTTSLSPELTELLAHLNPILLPARYVFVTIPSGRMPPDLPAIGSFQETEGTTLICPESALAGKQLTASDPFCLITLQVHSSLHAVGLLAVIATALAAENIPCNVISAFHHDHLFVPASLALLALQRLEQLSRDSAA